MKLTKESKSRLLNQFCGTGVIFMKTRENEYQILEFWLGKDNKFYTGGFPPKELTEFLYGIIPEIEKEV